MVPSVLTLLRRINMENRQKNHLTETDSIRTLVHVAPGEEVDRTAKKLVERMRQLEIQKWHIERELSSIRIALDVAGVKPEKKYKGGADLTEARYVRDEPFKNGMTLAQACYVILHDYTPEWLTKSQVEYLAVRGGYSFSTKDPRNSLDVTLRRLAAADKVEADKIRGSRGSKYRWVPRPIEAKEEIKAG